MLNQNDFIKTYRFLHEKREALDAIELLKLFAKHRGISIGIAADSDIPNRFQTTITTDERDNNSITMASNPIECVGSATKATNCVIQMQPSSPAIKIHPSNVCATDELLIEHAVPIDMKKNSADI